MGLHTGDHLQLFLRIAVCFNSLLVIFLHVSAVECFLQYFQCSPIFFLVRFLDSWQFWQLCSKFSSERVSVPQTASVFCISSWSFCLNNWACLTYWCSSCCNEFMKYAYGGLEKPIKTHAFCMALVDFSPPTGLLPPGRCGSARRCSVTVWGEKAVQEPCSWRLVCVFKCGY